MTNRRLQDIQRFKVVYQHEMDIAKTVTDCLRIQVYIDELEKEEKEILSKQGVEL